MKRVIAISVAIMLICLDSLVQADVFNMGSGLTSLETVRVDDQGNMADTRYANPGFGSVSYAYNIGKYEVTTAQYTEFLNAKARTDSHDLYWISMWSDEYGCKIQRSGISDNYSYTVASDRANRPVNYINYWDACRFANWLHNGQGNGDTETGAYTLNGYNGEDGRTIARNPGARWFVPSEDEWYKAAYYKGGGTNAGFWDYATQTGLDIDPDNHVVTPDPGNNANFNYAIGSPYYCTIVGEFENSASAYVTLDQGGNVQEWNETVVYVDANGYSTRGIRGGCFWNGIHEEKALYRGLDANPIGKGFGNGFRVASVPEPSSFLALGGGLAGFGALRRRKL